MASNQDPLELKQQILDLVEAYHRATFGAKEKFVPGKTRVPYAGRVFDEDELVRLVDASLEFWLTHGRYASQFEEEFARFVGTKHCLLVNSGSSANLVAFMALTSDMLGERKVMRGDEVITVAAGFPTTVAPIVQYGATPVFVDIDLATANIDTTLLEEAISPRTKAVVLAHTLGNPFDVKAVKEFCERHNLWLIEDNCDALGSLYDGRLTGTFGDIATSSFYPPHHMTMGEGGAVYTSDATLAKIALSLRDWGRDCICPSGVDNFCKRRFTRSYSALPFGYDHKYVYSHFGYNLKATEMQAAIGCAQLEKLPRFIEARKKNWASLKEGLSHLSEHFILPEPTKNSDPSWFGFLLTVKESAPFPRDQIVTHLESSGIQTRTLFAGNLVKHPCFDAMRAKAEGYRVAGSLENTDTVMSRAFWVGVYPGMQETMIEYMIEAIESFTKKHKEQ